MMRTSPFPPLRKMIYPALARAAGREGTDVVDVKLDKGGYVVSARGDIWAQKC